MDEFATTIAIARRYRYAQEFSARPSEQEMRRAQPISIATPGDSPQSLEEEEDDWSHK